ncbi:MAG: 5'-methylthioadenosine/S-adenosylhomocysteine nucleosidase [Gammaproteobacteria bacterium]|nr:5'-methylthioadenosine/S-adenosylhomocysteine nucleosidase [Gammaproteobacteria bacterium]
MFNEFFRRLPLYFFIVFFTSSVFAVDFGIISAVQGESMLIQQTLTNTATKTINGVTYLQGVLGNKSVVVVVSGIGNTDVTVAATRLISDFNPAHILFSGSAGKVDAKLNIGDVILGQESFSLDYGNQTAMKPSIEVIEKNPIRKSEEPLVFSGDKKLLKLIAELNASSQLLRSHDADGKTFNAKILPGKIASSDSLPLVKEQFKRLKKFSVRGIEMEGAGLMKVCWMFKKSCLLVRGVSNAADPAGYSSTTNKNEAWNKENERLGEINAAKTTIKIIKFSS